MYVWEALTKNGRKNTVSKKQPTTGKVIQELSWKNKQRIKDSDVELEECTLWPEKVHHKFARNV